MIQLNHYYKQRKCVNYLNIIILLHNLVACLHNRVNHISQNLENTNTFGILRLNIDLLARKYFRLIYKITPYEVS